MKTHVLLSVVVAILTVTASTSLSLAEHWETLAGASDEMEIKDGETALLVFVPDADVRLIYEKAGRPAVTFGLQSSNRAAEHGNRGQVTSASPMPLVGPAKLTLKSNSVVSLKVVTTQITKSPTVSNEAESFPSNAVVIPSNTEGPVEVVLESSSDLVTWNAAESGSYSASSTNRFFRVRALLP